MAPNRYFFDHNVSALLTHRIEYKLKKRVCYDWDFMVLGFMMIICGCLGLPPCNGLIPNSPMHSKALVVYKSRHQLKGETGTKDQLPALQRGRSDSCHSDAAVAADSEKIGELEKRLSPDLQQVSQRRPTVDRSHLAPDSPTSFQKDLPRQTSSVNYRKGSDANRSDAAAAVEWENARKLLEKNLSPQFDHVVDQRLSNLLQSGLVAIMLLILPVRCGMRLEVLRCFRTFATCQNATVYSFRNNSARCFLSCPPLS